MGTSTFIGLTPHWLMVLLAAWSGFGTPASAQETAAPSQPARPTIVKPADTGMTGWLGPMVDVHSQVDEDTDLSSLVPMLDSGGVSYVLLSTRFDQPSSEIHALAGKHPDRIVPAAKTKTKALMKSREGADQIFREEWQSYPYRAMAEVIMWHAAKSGVGAGQAVIEPDSPRLLPLLEASRKAKIPFMAHIEFAMLRSGKAAYMAKFKALLDANKDVNFGLIHMGQLDAEEAEQLLSSHPNVFLITSHSNPVTYNESVLPWTRLIEGEAFAPRWRPVIERFPDRFVLAFDNVFHFQWRKSFLPQVALWRKVLNTVPDELAHRIAHGNAERLWGFAAVQ